MGSTTIDYAAVHDPVLTSVRCMQDYVNCLLTGTPELKHILINEVEVILECKVCRKLFRSLANLVMHKQSFCKSTYKESLSKFPDFISRKETVIVQQDQLDMVDGASVDTVEKSDDSNQSAEDQLHSEKQYKPTSVITLEKIDSNANAVYQTVEVMNEESNDASLTAYSEPESELKEDNSVDEANWKNCCNISTLTCNICDQNYSSLKTLKFHCLHRHGKMRTFYPCLYCKLLFCQPWSCRRHMERSHQKTREQVLKLNDVIKKKSFSLPLDDLNEKGMPKHDPRDDSKLVVKMNPKLKAKVKPDDLRPEIEDTVGKTKRTDVKKMKSESCGSHMTTDGNDNNSYPCFNCGREYDVKGSLNKHLQRRSCFDQDSMTDKKPKRRELSTVLNNEQMKKVNKLIDRNRMQCRRCNRKFTNVSNLNRHAIRHVGISRFKCDICEFRCYNMGECRRHLLHTHRKTDYQRYIIDIEYDSEESSASVVDIKDVKGASSKPVVTKKNLMARPLTPSRIRRKQDLSNIRTDYGVSTRNSPKLARLVHSSFSASPRSTRNSAKTDNDKSDGQKSEVLNCNGSTSQNDSVGQSEEGMMLEDSLNQSDQSDEGSDIIYPECSPAVEPSDEDC